MNTLRDVEEMITKAFHNVKLGRGISIRQTQAMDQYQVDATRQEFNRLPRSEVVDDWTAIPDAELDRICTSFLDAEGFRYYIPALALSVLHRYESASMRVIGTLQSLYPKKNTWESDMQLYSLLDSTQKQALAAFLHNLPNLVSLGPEDPTVIERALRNYWAQYLSN